MENDWPPYRFSTSRKAVMTGRAFAEADSNRE